MDEHDMLQLLRDRHHRQAKNDMLFNVGTIALACFTFAEMQMGMVAAFAVMVTALLLRES